MYARAKGNRLGYVHKTIYQIKSTHPSVILALAVGRLSVSRRATVGKDREMVEVGVRKISWKEYWVSYAQIPIEYLSNAFWVSFYRIFRIKKQRSRLSIAVFVVSDIFVHLSFCKLVLFVLANILVVCFEKKFSRAESCAKEWYKEN